MFRLNNVVSNLYSNLLLTIKVILLEYSSECFTSGKIPTLKT